MKSYQGNEKVEAGLYLNLRQLSFETMDEEGRLPGERTDVYRKVPTWALLVVGPALGLVYVIFLPLIGFAMIAWVALVKMATMVEAADLTRVFKPAWQPAMAFFTRSKPAKDEPNGRDCWVTDVEKELAENEEGKEVEN